MALLSSYFVLARIAIPFLIPKNSASGNSCKTFCAIQRSDQKFISRYSSPTDKTYSSPSSNSIASPRKTASGNSCKHFCTIQQSDQNLWPFGAVILVRLDKTHSTLICDSIASPRKSASKNSCKTFWVIQRSDQKLWPL